MSDTITASDRDLIAEAIAAGRVQVFRPGVACGLTNLETVLSTSFPAATDNRRQKRSWAKRVAAMLRARELKG